MKRRKRRGRSQQCSARRLLSRALCDPDVQSRAIADAANSVWHEICASESMEAKPTSKPKIRERDVRGLKYFDQLAPLLERLHDVGCDRDSAGNRSLHFDNYCMLVLLYLGKGKGDGAQ